MSYHWYHYMQNNDLSIVYLYTSLTITTQLVTQCYLGHEIVCVGRPLFNTVLVFILRGLRHLEMRYQLD